jgi:Flp pilus assembly protein TadG
MTTDTLVNRLSAQVRRLRAAEHGNVLLTFALALVPLMGAVGAAVDYSRANNIRTQIQAAADAASVGAVAKSSPAMKAAASMTSDGPIPVGVTDALNIFNAQLGGKSGFSNLLVSASVVKASGDVTSTVQFNASVPTVILGIFSKGSMAINGTSKAANGIPLYVDFYLLLDNTPSMGVGATTADINTMVANTPDQCAFACHDLSTHPNNYYKKAKQLGVQMRIDVVRSATQQLIDRAIEVETLTNQFRAGVYTFGDSCTNPGLTTVKALTSNLPSAKAAAKNIDLMTIPYQGYNNDQCTNFDSVLTAMNGIITTPGSGTTASSPQKYVFFVADGVNDANNPASCSKPLHNGTRCQEPIDTTFCTTIKNRGIKLAVLYTTYLPLPTNPWYKDWIKPFQPEIGTKMQACASPGLYFEVNPSQGISDALLVLFQKALAQAHLIK